MKRFYKEATAEQTGNGQEDSGWRAVLDGRPIRTAAGNPQVVPTQALAQALAAEWAGQGETIDTAAFHYRDLADFAIDAVAPARDTVIAELLPYAETDTLCYRADPDEHLYKRQEAVWEPLLSSVEARLGVRFTRISGIIHKPQPDATLACLRGELEACSDFELAALKMLSSLAASLVIALEAIRPGTDADALWQAAELEADWQVEQWGEDWEAAERRTARLEAFKLAIGLATLSR